MGIFSKNTNVQESSIVEYDSAMLVDEADMALQIASKLNKVKYKGEVELKEKMFPVALGEEHPFDFSQMEGLYKRFGFANGVVEKFLDFVIGPGFYVESDDERAKEIINDFMENVNFDTILRAWGKEAMVFQKVLKLGMQIICMLKEIEKVILRNIISIQVDLKDLIKLRL